MYQAKLAMNISNQFGLPLEEQISVLREVGFDGFFASWMPGSDIAALRRAADAWGMKFEFIHSNHLLMAHMWEQTEKTEEAVAQLISCVRDCGENGVDTMVAHTIIGFDKHTPTQLGLDNFGRVMREAEKCQVKLAFENLEGEEYLTAIMHHFRGHPLAGFCWDTGHEMCYNHGKDMLALYGDRLLCTHLNDNLGIQNFEGNIRWQDDLHLLPFDGIGDWHEMMQRLEKTGYQGTLTFELKIDSMPGRRENDLYRKMDIRDYFTQAYMRACRVAALKIRAAQG
ncbi:MAG: sugar phosphate isomerase/epimerase [Clostridiales bacterium]|nr:sugar phosphate isomerase/epimerase [Clostridiales bacterium]